MAMRNTEDLPVGTMVNVDESKGLSRNTWYGEVTHNEPTSPYIMVDGHSVRRYEIMGLYEPGD
jgi:hypothetical protein